MKRGILLIILSISMLLMGCAGKTSPSQTALTSSVSNSPSPTVWIPEYVDGKELFASIDSRDTAEELAELYGIILVDFSYGIAVFHTEENPIDVLSRGEANNWPKLSVNYNGHPDIS